MKILRLDFPNSSSAYSKRIDHDETVRLIGQWKEKLSTVEIQNMTGNITASVIDMTEEEFNKAQKEKGNE